jgi:hypothetical protein
MGEGQELLQLFIRLERVGGEVVKRPGADQEADSN